MTLIIAPDHLYDVFVSKVSFITSLKILKSHENLVLLQKETDARRNPSKVWL